MRLLSLIVLFIVTHFGYGQDVTKLSKDNGFLHFKYQTTPSDYDDISRRNEDAGKLAVYSYEGSEKISFGGHDPSGVFLFFKDNKALHKIEVQFEFDSDQGFKDVLNHLEKIYGSGESNPLSAAVFQVDEFWSWVDGDYNLDILFTEEKVVIVRFFSMKNL